MISLRTINIGDDGRITEADYSMISAWWKARASEAPPRSILPTLGVIAFHEEIPLAASFAYLDGTGSGVALLAWMVTDPNHHSQRAGRALKKSIDFLHLECARLNYWVAWSTVSNPSLVSYLQRDGYQLAESNLTHLFKPLPKFQPSPASEPIQPLP